MQPPPRQIVNSSTKDLYHEHPGIYHLDHRMGAGRVGDNHGKVRATGIRRQVAARGEARAAGRGIRQEPEGMERMQAGLQAQDEKVARAIDVFLDIINQGYL